MVGSEKKDGEENSRDKKIKISWIHPFSLSPITELET
jgi:hypothetical protein